MKNFHMISGLPRAGSTLLCQILNSNPNFHVTPTSGVLDMLKVMRSNFSQNVAWRAQDRLKIYDNFKNGLKGFLEGYFEGNKTVFDKNRGWTNNIQLIDSILGDSSAKVLWCYRDPVEIVSSIESQYQRTNLIENMDESGAPGAFATLERRIATYTSNEGIMSFPVEALRDAIEMNYSDRIRIVRYYDLTTNTQAVMDDIHDFIGEKRHNYKLDAIKQTTWEFDGVYNYKFMHTIKEGEIKFKKGDYQLLPRFIAHINNHFAALNKLVLEGDAGPLLGIPSQPAPEQTAIETDAIPSEGMAVENVIKTEEENKNPFGA